MPWKETTIMEQKIEFICEWRTGKHTITELCKSFEISRPTAYKIIARFEQEGYEGLRELSRKPKGIHPVFSDPSHPEQNGRHERMHRDLKAACAKPSAYDLRAQQRRLNRFVKEYNHVRPHEALGMETPASVHNFSTCPFPEKIPNFDYDSEMKVLKVTQNGSMRWGAYNWVYLTASLKGKYVGALEMGNGIRRVFYRNIFLGYFDENELRTKEKSVRLETNLV